MSEFRRRLMMVGSGGGGGGDLPAGYTRLQYIKSEGGYIDTGQTLQLGDVVELDMWVKSACTNMVFYGYRRSGGLDNNYHIYGGIGYGSGDLLQTYYYISAHRNTPTFSFSPPTDSRHKVRIETGSTNYMYVDDVLTYTNEGTDGFNENGSSVYNPCIFTFNQLGTPNTTVIAEGSRCYGYKVKRGGSSVLELIPAQRNSDQVNGLYDVVNGAFLTSPNSVAFSSNLDEVVPLYPITAWYGDKGTARYSASTDGHIGFKLGSSGDAFIWLQDVSQNANSTPGSTNINNKPKIFSIKQGDSLVFNVKNITRLTTGDMALNVRTTNNGNIGVSTGNFTNSTDKTISVTAASDYDVAGVFLYWRSTGSVGRGCCADVELWVNNVRYI